MRSERKSLMQGRGTGDGLSPALSQRLGAGLAAATCCLALLVALDANLSGLVSSVSRREVSSFTLFTPTPPPPTVPPSRPREIKRPPDPQSGMAIASAQTRKQAAAPAPSPVGAPLSSTSPPTPLMPSIDGPSRTNFAVDPAPAPDSKAESVLASYQGQLWARIAARKPRGLNLSGVAMVRFAVGRAGELISVELAASSGNAALDRLALRTVRNAGPFPPPPATVEGDQLVFTIPFSFH